MGARAAERSRAPWLGEISYGIFAIHMLVLNLVFGLLDLPVFTGRFLTVSVLTLGITIALASASYYLFERKILKAKNARFVTRTERAPRAARGVTSS